MNPNEPRLRRVPTGRTSLSGTARVENAGFFGLGFLLVALILIFTQASRSSFLAMSGTGDAEQDRQALTPEEFWMSVTHYGRYNYTYSTLHEIVADSHLIVRGRIVGTEVGMIRSFEENPLHEGLQVAFGIVAIDEVLKGVPESETTGRILVARLAHRDTFDAELPEESIVLFLKNYPVMRADAGVGQSSDPRDRYYYTRPNGYQGLIRIVDDRAVTVRALRDWPADDPFPTNLDGMPVADLLAEIATAVAEADQN